MAWTPLDDIAVLTEGIHELCKGHGHLEAGMEVTELGVGEEGGARVGGDLDEGGDVALEGG